MGPLRTFIDALFWLLNLVIIGRVLISWVNLPPDHPVVEFLYSVTEPILGPIRRILPRTGMFDLSPIVAILLLELVRSLLLGVLGAR
jgi:YggT family protein